MPNAMVPTGHLFKGGKGQIGQTATIQRLCSMLDILSQQLSLPAGLTTAVRSLSLLSIQALPDCLWAVENTAAVQPQGSKSASAAAVGCHRYSNACRLSRSIQTSHPKPGARSWLSHGMIPTRLMPLTGNPWRLFKRLYLPVRPAQPWSVPE